MNTFNPAPAIARAAETLAFARRVAAGGLAVARERYDYNRARRLVAAIKRCGALPEKHYEVDASGNVFLFRIEPSLWQGSFSIYPHMDFFCRADDSIETAIMAATR